MTRPALPAALSPALARPYLLLLLALLVLPACNGQEGDGQQTNGDGPEKLPENRYGIQEWYEDFPYRPELPAVWKPGLWYARSRTEALQKVIANLEGACSRNA